MMSEKIKENIRSCLSQVHNTYVGKERDRLAKIKEELEEQKQVIKLKKRKNNKNLKFLFIL